MTNEIMNRNNLMRDFFNGDKWMNNFPSFFEDGISEDSNLKTDIKETDKTYEVHVDMPAFDKKNIDIDYQNDVLTISGRRDSFNDHTDKNGEMIMSERSSGRFMRQYRLPEADVKNIKATYDNGVLEITLPKLEKEVNSEYHINIE